MLGIIFASVDWQQISALAIVALTAALLARRQFRRRRKFQFGRDTHCGCSTPAQGSPSTIVFHSRKGETPTVTMKLK